MALAIRCSWVSASKDLPPASSALHCERWVRGSSKLTHIPSRGEQRGRKQGDRVVRSCAGEDEYAKGEAVESRATNQEFRVAAAAVDFRETPSCDLLPVFGSLSMSPKMSRRAAVWTSLAFLGGRGGFCSCCTAAAAPAPAWSYGDPQWGGTCAIGARQSPIDVRVHQALHEEASGELQFDYKRCVPTFENPGHGTMQVNFPEGVNKLRVKGRELNLVQFHFHTPSEHAFDGLRFPMEAHLVHRTWLGIKMQSPRLMLLLDRSLMEDFVEFLSHAGKVALVCRVMLDATPDAYSNGALAAALRYSPLEHGDTLTLPNVQVSANDLLPSTASKDDRHYIHYTGSFTTPPCTESVDWFLLEKPLRVSTSEVLEFMKFVGDERTLSLNARPIQPLGDREIFEGP